MMAYDIILEPSFNILLEVQNYNTFIHIIICSKFEQKNKNCDVVYKLYFSREFIMICIDPETHHPIMILLSSTNEYSGISRLVIAGPFRIRPAASKCEP